MDQNFRACRDSPFIETSLMEVALYIEIFTSLRLGDVFGGERCGSAIASDRCPFFGSCSVGEENRIGLACEEREMHC